MCVANFAQTKQKIVKKIVSISVPKNVTITVVVDVVIATAAAAAVVVVVVVVEVFTVEHISRKITNRYMTFTASLNHD